MKLPAPLNNEQRQALRDLLRSPGWTVISDYLDRKRAMQADNALDAANYEDVRFACGYATAIDALLHFLRTQSVEVDADGSPHAE